MWQVQVSRIGAVLWGYLLLLGDTEPSSVSDQHGPHPHTAAVLSVCAHECEMIVAGVMRLGCCLNLRYRLYSAPNCHFKGNTFNYTFIIWLCCMVCGVLVPRPGVETGPSAARAQSPNCWIAGEFL